MKKALSLILALVMCLSLCACGSEDKKDNVKSTPTQEELMASIETFNLTKFRKDCTDNLLRAKETYIGKVYKISGFIAEIKEDCCVFDSSVVVPLSKDTITRLSVGDCITVVGRVGDVAHEEETQQSGLGTSTTIHNILTMDVAYYLGEAKTFTAKVIYLATNGGLVMLLDDFANRYCEINISLTQEEVNQFKYGDIISIKGTMVKNSNSKDYNFAGERYHAYLSIYGATIEKT